MKIEALTKITVRTSQGDVELRPGQHIDLPDAVAKRLLERAKGKVRAITTTASPDLRPGSVIPWYSRDGKECGLAVVEGTFQDQGDLWVWFTYDGTEYITKASCLTRDSSKMTQP